MLQNVPDMNLLDVKLPFIGDGTWLPGGLPTQAAEWPLPERKSAGKRGFNEVLQRSMTLSPWEWPRRPVFFVADPHADAEAFIASLVASGGVCKTGPGHREFRLTPEGQNGLFVIGGDCLDKGPSNLQLLESIRELLDTGADVKLLAGNHDMRLLMGIRALGLPRDTTTEHLFVRMGPKVVPLLREVYDRYLAVDGGPELLSRKACRKLLYPSDDWFEVFPRKAAGVMSAIAIDKELKRMAKKVEGFEAACLAEGLTLPMVYATAEKCRELFLEPRGDFAWFFNQMQLVHREGSFLFIHAGLDDCIASLLATHSEAYLNQLYRDQVEKDLFNFYYGPLANTMRTKYRDIDRPLTQNGVDVAGRYGVHAVVHGHRNRTNGQRIILRQGMIHIEGDITLDRNSRRKEGLQGIGMGATIIRPEGCIIGISNDYPYAKVFEPHKHLQK